MLQPSSTTPAVLNTTGAAGLPEYNGNSKRLAGENEYTWWRTLSLFGKRTRVPVVMTVTRGVNCELRWSITAASGVAAAAADAECRLATASMTALPPARTVIRTSVACAARASSPAPASTAMRMPHRSVPRCALCGACLILEIPERSGRAPS